MLKGRYLNPKYRKRQRQRRRATIGIMAMVLTVGCVLAIWRVDTQIRGTMLPAAPPVAELMQQEEYSYRLSFFGKQYTLSTKWLYSLAHELDGVLRTPPAEVRFFFQLRAYLTDKLPRNLRANPRISSEV